MPRIRMDLVEAFASVLHDLSPSVGEIGAEAELARRIDCEPRLVQALRAAGLLAPLRRGRGLVYRPAETRLAKILVSLTRLGATVDDLSALLSLEPASCGDCPARDDAPCAANHCAEIFLDRLKCRTEDEISRLEALDRLLVDWSRGWTRTAAPGSVASYG